MFRICFPALLTGLCFANLASGQTEEPPQRYFIEQGDEKIPVELDKPFSVEGAGRTELKLSLRPSRLFPHAGLEFEFPAGFSFEAMVDEESGNWTLEGEQCMVIVVELPDEEMEHHEMAESIATGFDEAGEEAEYADVRVKLADMTLGGTELRVKLDDYVFAYDVWSIPTEGGSRFLVLQDGLDESGEHSEEFNRLREMVQRSLRVTRPDAQVYQ